MAFLDDLDMILGGLGTAAGIYGTVSGYQRERMIEDWLKQQQIQKDAAARRSLELSQRAERAGEGPLDVSPYLSLYTKEAEDAGRRGFLAQKAAEGKPLEGGYMDNQLMEAMARMRTEHVDKALDAAMKARSGQMSGYNTAAGALGGVSGTTPAAYSSAMTKIGSEGLASIPLALQKMILAGRRRADEKPVQPGQAVSDEDLSTMYGITGLPQQMGVMYDPYEDFQDWGYE